MAEKETAFLARHGIVAAAVVVAVLAGTGITVVDHPWPSAHGTLRDAERPPEVKAVAAEPAPPPTARKKEKRPASEKHPASEKRPASEKSLVSTTPLASSKRMAPEERRDSQKPAIALPPSLDARYESEIGKCRTGIAGLPCRELTRWRLCLGRWNDGDPGATRCRGARRRRAFRSAT